MNAPLTPDRRWRLLEHAGFQMLVTCDVDEENDSLWRVETVLATDAIDIAIRVRCHTEATARQIFEGIDAAKAHAQMIEQAASLSATL